MEADGHPVTYFLSAIKRRTNYSSTKNNNYNKFVTKGNMHAQQSPIKYKIIKE